MVPFTENPQFHAHKIVKVLLCLIASDIYGHAIITNLIVVNRKLLQSGVHHQCPLDVVNTYSKISVAYHIYS